MLKLLVVRGGNARGYAPAAGAVTAWQLSRHALPAAPPPAGLRLHWCETRLAVQPALAGLKHCNRLEQVLARAESDAAGCDEGLVRDGDGWLQPFRDAELASLAEKVGLPTVATGDVHYLRDTDARAHEALLCIQSASPAAQTAITTFWLPPRSSFMLPRH